MTEQKEYQTVAVEKKIAGKGCLVLSSEFEIKEMNSEFKAMMGSGEIPFGSKCYSLFKGADYPCHDCPVLSAMVKEKIERRNVKLYTDDGYRMFEMTAYPSYERGMIENIVCEFLDTAHLGVDAGNAVFAEEGKTVPAGEDYERFVHRFKRISENIPLGILVEGEDRKISFTNREFAKIFGIADDGDLKGQDSRTFGRSPCELSREDRAFINQTDTLVLGHRPVHMEHVSLPNGCYTARDFLPLTNDKGESYYVWIYRDITEPNNHFRELKNSCEEKSALLRDLQHRAKNCFTMIDGIVQLMADDSDTREKQLMLSSLSHRIQIFADLYSHLYSCGSFSEVKADRFIGEITDSFLGIVPVTQLLSPLNVNFRTAVSLGMIISEFFVLFQNNVFKQDREGQVTLRLKKMDSFTVLELTVNGNSFTAWDELINSNATEFMLIDIFSRQIRGDYSMEKSDRFRFRLHF